MNPTHRTPLQSDYKPIESWIPDAQACLRWAGPRLLFPFIPDTLPGKLQVDVLPSYVLADGSAGPLGFGQHWVATADSVHLGRIIISPNVR